MFRHSSDHGSEACSWHFSAGKCFIHAIDNLRSLRYLALLLLVAELSDEPDADSTIFLTPTLSFFLVPRPTPSPPSPPPSSTRFMASALLMSYPASSPRPRLISAAFEAARDIF